MGICASLVQADTGLEKDTSHSKPIQVETIDILINNITAVQLVKGNNSDLFRIASLRRWDLGFGRSRRRDLVRDELVKRVQKRKCRVMWACQRINWCSQCKRRKKQRNFY